jgi:hypothetical protein
VPGQVFKNSVCTVGGTKDGRTELLGPGRMVYVTAKTIIVPPTNLQVGTKVFADIEGDEVVRVRPLAFDEADIQRFRRVNEALFGVGLGEVALGDPATFLANRWREEAAKGNVGGPTDPLREFDAQMVSKSRRYPMTWWHDDPEPGVLELANEFLAPRGLSTELPLQAVRDDLDARVGRGEDEATARRHAISMLVGEANRRFQQGGLPDRFFEFPQYTWEDNEPVWYLMTPEQQQRLTESGVFGAVETLQQNTSAPLGSAAPTERTGHVGTFSLLQVLTQPRATYPTLAAKSSLLSVLVLSCVWGVERNFDQLFKRAMDANDLKPMAAVFASNVFFGGLFGIYIIWVSSWLFAWAARKLGGAISDAQMRVVLAWSALPKALILVFLVGLYLVLGDDFLLFDRKHLLKASPALVLPVVAVQVVCDVWSIVLGVVGLSVLSKLSVLRSVGAYVLGGVILLVPFFAGIWLWATFGKLVGA